MWGKLQYQVKVCFLLGKSAVNQCRNNPSQKVFTIAAREPLQLVHHFHIEIEAKRQKKLKQNSQKTEKIETKQ